MDLSRARGTGHRRATPGKHRTTGAQGRISGLAGAAAAELARMRPAGRHRARRSRSESVIDRIRHLV